MEYEANISDFRLNQFMLKGLMFRELGLEDVEDITHNEAKYYIVSLISEAKNNVEFFKVMPHYLHSMVAKVIKEKNIYPSGSTGEVPDKFKKGESLIKEKMMLKLLLG